MKKTTLLTSVLLLFAFMVNAQEDTSEMPNNEYNKWSVDAGLGLVKASTPFSSGYASPEFGNISYNLSVRYMFNEKFGLKVGGLYSKLEESDDSSSFSTGLTTFTGEAVVGLGSVLNFNQFADWLSVLGHAGFQVSSFNFDDAITSRDNDNTFGLIAGLTPQIKLSDNVALFADLSVVANASHNGGIDGNNRGNRRDFDGFVAMGSAGVTFYLGNNEKHADWVNNSPSKLLGDRVEKLENELAQIEKDMMDTDKDGVADYLDREPNTTSGVAVNTKGESVDTNQNNIPDELETSLTQIFATKEYVDQAGSGSGIEGVKPDANDDLVNVYFKFDSTQPEYYSLDAISSIVKYMRVYPEANAVLTGYADQIGNNSYNNKLSEDRAKRVYDIVVAAGIDASRLSYEGGGVDTSVSKDSEEARQMVRRVSFKLK